MYHIHINDLDTFTNGLITDNTTMSRSDIVRKVVLGYSMISVRD